MIDFKKTSLPLLSDKNYSPLQILFGIQLQLVAQQAVHRSEYQFAPNPEMFRNFIHKDLKQALWNSIYGDISNKLTEIDEHLIRMEGITSFPLEVRKLVEELRTQINETKP